MYHFFINIPFIIFFYLFDLIQSQFERMYLYQIIINEYLIGKIDEKAR